MHPHNTDIDERQEDRQASRETAVFMVSADPIAVHGMTSGSWVPFALAAARATEHPEAMIETLPNHVAPIAARRTAR